MWAGLPFYLVCYLIPYLYIYTTTRFTLFAKVKVIIEAEVKLVAVSHRVILCFWIADSELLVCPDSLFSFVLRCKDMPFLSFCQEKDKLFYQNVEKTKKSTETGECPPAPVLQSSSPKGSKGSLPFLVPEVDIRGLFLLDENLVGVWDRSTAFVDIQWLCHHLYCTELNGQRCWGNICLFHCRLLVLKSLRSLKSLETLRSLFIISVFSFRSRC